MKIKLEFTIESAIKMKACERLINTFRSYLKFTKIIHDTKTKFNLKTLLITNNVEDTIWALRCTLTSSKYVSIEIAHKAAIRAKEYTKEATFSQIISGAPAAELAYSATELAARSAAWPAAYSAAEAELAEVEERKKQKQDLLYILGN